MPGMKAMNDLSVLQVVSEIAPLSQTGGLGTVTAQLSRALATAGAKVTVVSPRYGSTDPSRFSLARRLKKLQVPLGPMTYAVELYEGTLPGTSVRVYLLDHPLYSARQGIYGEDGVDYPDNADRFALLARAAVEVAREVAGIPDVFHAHDWMAGLLPLYVEEALPEPLPAVVHTVHDPGAKGLAPREAMPRLGLPPALFTPEALEFYGQVSLLKAGVVYADRVIVPSPSYARQVCTPPHGKGLEGLFGWQREKLVGVLHGFDHWDPSRDRQLPETFSVEDASGKGACKAAVQEAFGLPVRPDAMLVATGAISAAQVRDVVAAIGELPVQLAVLGNETELAVPERVAVRPVGDEVALRRVMAGADVWLDPGVEPAAVVALGAMRYGAVPVGPATGALEDVLVDYDVRTATGTGFRAASDGPGLGHGVVRAALLWRAEGRFEHLRRNVMRQALGWARCASQTLEVYRDALRSARG